LKLKVKKARSEDIYRDIIRIPEKYRDDDLEHRTITEGSVCRIIANSKSIYAVLRGNILTEEKEVLIDERLRNRLGLKLGEEIEFNIKKSPWYGEFLWAWYSSDPAYRINTRVTLLSLILGLIALIISIVSLTISFRAFPMTN
jgi:hypothetical protein